MEIKSLSICLFNTLSRRNTSGRLQALPRDNRQGIWKNQTRLGRGRNCMYSLSREMSALDFTFQFCPGAPRGEKAMLQHYRWREAQESLAGVKKCRRPWWTLLSPNSTASGPFLTGRSCLPTDEALGNCRRAKASGLVVGWKNRFLHTRKL